MSKTDRFHLKIILVLFSLIAIVNLSRAQFVTGHVLIPGGADSWKGKLIEIGYLNTYRLIPADSMNTKDWKGLLNSVGVHSDSIINIRCYSNLTTGRIEVFFAYKGKQLTDYSDVTVRDGIRAVSGYAKNNAIIVPAFQFINEGLDQTIYKIARSYPCYSFLCKPFSSHELAFSVLSFSPVGGELADMRNIANSYLLVPFFKSLNWKNIWYNESGKQKNIIRPKTGWQ